MNTFDVGKIAKLARIQLDKREEEQLCGEMQSIVDMVGRFPDCILPDNVDSQPSSMPLRADLPAPSLLRAELLANAPQTQEGLFVLPLSEERKEESRHVPE